MKTEKFKVGETYKGTGEVNGINFTLLKRHGDTCLFERTDNHFEVIRVLHREAKTLTIKGKTIHAKDREIYPKGELWDGRCLNSYDRALSVFKEMLND